MQIFASGLSPQTIALDVDASQSVASVKSMLSTKSGVPAQELRLNYKTAVLSDSHKLSDYGVEKASTIVVSLRLLGGADDAVIASLNAAVADHEASIDRMWILVSAAMIFLM
jgi:hypothetical protein